MAGKVGRNGAKLYAGDDASASDATTVTQIDNGVGADTACKLKKPSRNIEKSC